MNLLISHPDDEVIFGWPVLKQAKNIICCSSDLNNPERQWCKHRKQGLFEIGEMVGAKVICLDYNSEFYRLPTRTGELANLVLNVLTEINKHCEDDLLFTHNSHGEYGHLDHILCHQIAKASGKKIMTTDIALDAGWFKVNNSEVKWNDKEVINDLDFYNKCKKIYDKIGCWTWSKPPIERAIVYESH